MWGIALDSSDFLLSYRVISLASHITIILISTLKHTIFALQEGVQHWKTDQVLSSIREERGRERSTRPGFQCD